MTRPASRFATGTGSTACGRSATSRRCGAALAARAAAVPAGRAGAASRSPTWPTPTTGIGHTRWATHGGVTRGQRASRTPTATDRVHVVLNGIVENHASCARRSSAGGQSFTSQTDAEVVAHLIGALYDGDLTDAVRAAYAQLHGELRVRRDERRRARRCSSGARRDCAAGRRRRRRRACSSPPAISAFAAYDRRSCCSSTTARSSLRRRRASRSSTRRARRRSATRRRSTSTRRGGRPRRVRDVHAQGDLRAVRRRGAHARGPARQRPDPAPRARPGATLSSPASARCGMIGVRHLAARRH